MDIELLNQMTLTDLRKLEASWAKRGSHIREITDVRRAICRKEASSKSSQRVLSKRKDNETQKATKRKKRRLKSIRKQKKKSAERTAFVTPDYKTYIRSKPWKSKIERIKRIRKHCEICGSSENLQGHHKHYRTLGREKDKDIEILCKACHSNHHEAEGKCLSPSSERFVQLMQAIL